MKWLQIQRFTPLSLGLINIKEEHFFYFFCAPLSPRFKEKIFLINLAEISNLHNKGEQYVLLYAYSTAFII